MYMYIYMCVCVSIMCIYIYIYTHYIYILWYTQWYATIYPILDVFYVGIAQIRLVIHGVFPLPSTLSVLRPACPLAKRRRRPMISYGGPSTAQYGEPQSDWFWKLMIYQWKEVPNLWTKPDLSTLLCSCNSLPTRINLQWQKSRGHTGPGSPRSPVPLLSVYGSVYHRKTTTTLISSLILYTLWLFNIANGKSPCLIGKPSISIGAMFIHVPWLC